MVKPVDHFLHLVEVDDHVLLVEDQRRDLDNDVEVVPVDVLTLARIVVQAVRCCKDTLELSGVGHLQPVPSNLVVPCFCSDGNAPTRFLVKDDPCCSRISSIDHVTQDLVR
jgi:hypothetical protein